MKRLLSLILVLGLILAPDLKINAIEQSAFTPIEGTQIIEDLDFSDYDEYATFTKHFYYKITLPKYSYISISAIANVFKSQSYGRMLVSMSKSPYNLGSNNRIINSSASNKEGKFSTLLSGGTYYLDVIITKSEWLKGTFVENPTLCLTVNTTKLSHKNSPTNENPQVLKVRKVTKGILSADEKRSWYQVNLPKKGTLSYNVLIDTPTGYTLGGIYCYLYNKNLVLLDKQSISWSNHSATYKSTGKLGKGTYYICVRNDSSIEDKQNVGVVNIYTDYKVPCDAPRVRYSKGYVKVKSVKGTLVNVSVKKYNTSKVYKSKWLKFKVGKLKKGTRIKVKLSKKNYYNITRTYKI